MIRTCILSLNLAEMEKLKEENQALKDENERLSQRMSDMQKKIDSLDGEFLATADVSVHIYEQHRQV